MADIRNWDAFRAGRWDWNRLGYEDGFPRGCGFTDIDAAVEFDGRMLIMEGKWWNGHGEIQPVPVGQRIFLERLTALGIDVRVLYGVPADDNPLALYDVGTRTTLDWRDLEIEDRRVALKREINRVMGL